MEFTVVEINWDNLFAWPGYDFWGVVLALIGFSFSIFFAYSANSSAKMAAEAAQNARRSMNHSDAAAQLTLVQQLLVELRLRIDASQWEQVSEKCEGIRVIVAPIVSSTTVELSKETEKSLVGLQSQMASLQKTANDVHHNAAEYDVVKIKSILSKQAEAVAQSVREFKDNTEIGYNV